MVHARHTHLICGFMFTLFILEKYMLILQSHKGELFVHMMGIIMRHLFCIIRGS